MTTAPLTYFFSFNSVSVAYWFRFGQIEYLGYSYWLWWPFALAGTCTHIDPHTRKHTPFHTRLSTDAGCTSTKTLFFLVIIFLVNCHPEPAAEQCGSKFGHFSSLILVPQCSIISYSPPLSIFLSLSSFNSSSS